MKEKLITFETAELAKEKGADLISSETWVKGKDGEISTISDWEISKGKWDEDWYEDLGFYALPQSLLKKWLFEKHNLWVSVEFLDTRGFYVDVYKINGNRCKVLFTKFGTEPHNLKELGLFEALNFIK